ncbi:MAG: helix-turn-helix transcriptional regulator [Candidatus Taylorbacteria bacterium]|nr:helix-turn-helix transcriptional regulator [Candidatus Taylorbacteria bacterium]
MKNFEELEKEFLKDPENKRAYDDLELEFKIYEALINARIEQKLTQKQLAKQLGIAQSARARFESGRTNPTLSFLQKVTTGLGLKLTIL